MNREEYYTHPLKPLFGKEREYTFNPLKSTLYISLFLVIPLVVATIFMSWVIYHSEVVSGNGGNLVPVEDLMASTSYWISNLLAQVITLGVYFYLIKKHQLPIFNREKWTKEKVRFLLWFTPVIILGPSLLMNLSNYLSGKTGTTANQVAVVDMVDGIPLWISFLLIVVIAPLLEEIAFRGFILFSTKGSEVTWLRAIISGVIFSILHGPTDIVSFLIYFLMGFGMAYAVKRTNLLESSIIIHLFNNAIGFLSIVLM